MCGIEEVEPVGKMDTTLVEQGINCIGYHYFEIHINPPTELKRLKQIHQRRKSQTSSISSFFKTNKTKKVESSTASKSTPKAPSPPDSSSSQVSKSNHTTMKDISNIPKNNAFTKMLASSKKQSSPIKVELCMDTCTLVFPPPSSPLLPMHKIIKLKNPNNKQDVRTVALLYKDSSEEYKPAHKPSSMRIPVMKSCLQKSVRRGKVDKALKMVQEFLVQGQVCIVEVYGQCGI